jgi:DNA invertase Pin-like site-specific DNA recombinase
MWECIDDVKFGRANVILVWEYARLGRNSTERAVIKYEVETKYGGKILSATQVIDDGPMAGIVEAVMAATDELERNNVVARMERGKRYRASQGKLCAAPFARYGYRFVDDRPGQRTAYAVDETTGPVVKRIFAWGAEGKPTRWIARQLSAEGIPAPTQHSASRGRIGTRKISPHWHYEAVRRILINLRRGDPLP